MANQSFETIIHLAGEQPLPIYIGMMQFDCQRHVIAVTEKTRVVGETLKLVAEKRGVHVELLDVPAYDTEAAQKAFAARLERNKAGAAAMNLTGGTKPMFSAGYQACFRSNVPMYYVETTCRELHWLGESHRKEALRPAMNSVRTFVELAGCRLNTAVGEHMASSLEGNNELLDACWTSREAIGRWQSSLSRLGYNQHPGVPFKSDWNGKGMKFFAELQGPPTYAGTLRIGKVEKRDAPWMDLAGFITGGWFELFAYRHLLALKQADRIRDIVLNATVEIVDNTNENTMQLQEFDVAFTDGFLLTIVECKAGAVDQDHVQKLENLTQRFGGHFGHGLLVSVFPLKDEAALRIEGSRHVGAIVAGAVPAEPGNYLEVRSGEILGAQLRRRPQR